MNRSIPAAVAALAILAGCSGYRDPELRVVQTNVRDRTADGVVVDVTIEASNANGVELPLKEVRYDLLVGGQRVFSGFRSPEATLRRYGTQQIRLPASVPADLAAGGSAGYEVRGVLEYTTPGEIAEILFENDLRRPKVSFAQTGTIDLSRPGPTASGG